MIIECCICRDYKDKKMWYTPTTEERRTAHFHKLRISHTYCPICSILTLREQGFSDGEIENIVKKAEEIK